MKQVEIIDKNKFAKIELNKESEIFMIYLVAFKALLVKMTIHSLQKIQIVVL